MYELSPVLAASIRLTTSLMPVTLDLLSRKELRSPPGVLGVSGSRELTEPSVAAVDMAERRVTESEKQPREGRVTAWNQAALQRNVHRRHSRLIKERADTNGL